MPEKFEAKPYLHRIKHWKIRNMVMLYLEAREQFKNYRRSLKKDSNLSFEKLKNISDILFEIKEDHHLLYKRVLNPRKKKFEKAQKFTPDDVETEFMNNIGLLFHKVMAAREIKYIMEHYVEESETFQKNLEDLNFHLNRIENLFDQGIKTLKQLISRNRDNILLLTYFLENRELTQKCFGNEISELFKVFANNKDVSEVYYLAARFYFQNGWKDRAQTALKELLKNNPEHPEGKQLATKLK